MLYAHSLPDQPPEMWQLLKTHLFEVAELAASLAAAFNASALAFIVGYLHDLGKVSDPVQKRIHGTGPKTDHSTAGARELIERWLEQNTVRTAGRWPNVWPTVSSDTMPACPTMGNMIWNRGHCATA